MAPEIERKFFVKGDFISQAEESLLITQGYLSLDKERVVRIRIQNEKAFITIKGKSNASGLSRFEWEKEIDQKEALELMKLVVGSPIEKIRYRIPIEKHVFEVDVFSGKNEGLILAEIELSSEAEVFTKPSWLGKEVSGDSRFYNANLVLNPFSKWG
ncbi:MAG: CYTH domain-containing protein [Bacteroidales bacterium]|nr:CYTH domain-containing protein [Bacteroidales bacterium]